MHQSAVPSPIAHDAALTNLTAIGQDAFAAMAAFIREQQAMAEAQQDRMLHLLREQHEQQRQEIERHRSAADALRTQAAERKMWEGQLTMLQTRLQSLHSAKLLTDDELYRCVDVLADARQCGERRRAVIRQRVASRRDACAPAPAEVRRLTDDQLWLSCRKAIGFQARTQLDSCCLSRKVTRF